MSSEPSRRARGGERGGLTTVNDRDCRSGSSLHASLETRGLLVGHALEGTRLRVCASSRLCVCVSRVCAWVRVCVGACVRVCVCVSVWERGFACACVCLGKEFVGVSLRLRVFASACLCVRVSLLCVSLRPRVCLGGRKAGLPVIT